MEIINHFSIKNWPINPEGSWPYSVLSDNFVKEAFFIFMPKESDCSTLVVRRALKVFLKRALPNYKKNNSPSIIEGTLDLDMALVRTLCDHSRAHSRISEMALQKEKVSQRFGQQRAKIARKRPNLDIASLLWASFMKEPENQEVDSWVRRISGALKEPRTPFFLTAERLCEAGPPTTWPCDPESLLFARIVLLMGSKLEKREALALFTKVAELGSSYFANIENENIYVTEEKNSDTSAIILRPQLCGIHEGSLVRIDDPVPSEDTERLLEALRHLDQAQIEMLDKLQAIDSLGVAELAKVEENIFNEHISAISLYRQLYIDHLKMSSLITSRVLKIRINIQEILGGGINLSESSETRPNEKLVIADLQLSLVKIGASSQSVLLEWIKDTGVKVIETENLRQLASLALENERLRVSRDTFGKDLISFIRQEKGILQVTQWLHELKQDELLALYEKIEGNEWLPLRAILLCLITESGSAFNTVIKVELGKQSHQHRRETLRFYNPTASGLDGDLSVKRLVALERFRDAIIFGPLAQVSDPAAGLSDVNTVGKTVFEITEVLTEHLDVLNNGNDLQGLLSNSDEIKEALNTFYDFVRSPIMMTGIYKRLREAARDIVFLPLCEDRAIHSRQLKDTLAKLRSGEALEEIVALVSGDNSHWSIESRHRLQLERYLKQGTSCLEHCKMVQTCKLNSRETALREKIHELLLRLRDGGDFGSIEWFENEVSSALLMKAAPEYPTLLGDVQGFFDRLWTEQDNQWARQYIAIPELYDDSKRTGREVFSTLLWWHANGQLPAHSQIVQTLIENERFLSARLALNELKDISNHSELLLLLKERTTPLQKDSRKRVAALRQRWHALDLSDEEPFFDIERCIENFDYENAQVCSDLLELTLIDAEDLLQVEQEDEVDRGKREYFSKFLLKAGVTFDEHTPLFDLEKRWIEELNQRKRNRLHIILAKSVLVNAKSISSDVAQYIISFYEQTDNPDTWLPDDVSELFSEMLSPSTSKLRTWIDSYRAYSSHAQEALVRLLGWYLKFFLENSLILNASAGEPNDGPLEQVYEVSDIIAGSADPINCVAKLTEIGEVLELISTTPTEETGILKDDVEIQQQNEGVISSAKQSEDHTPSGGMIPAKLGEWIITNQWSVVLENAATANWDDANKFAELARLMLAQERAENAIISSEVAEFAIILSSDTIKFIPRAIRMEIAFRLIAIAVDIVNKPYELTWSETLGQRADLTRAISSVSGNNKRTLENLMKGNLGTDIAERLWETGTNTAEPQVSRTPLLHWLYERCSPELVLKLAHKYEPTLRDRLEQLFEIRSIAVSRPDLVPVAASLAAQISQQVKTAPFRNFVRGLPSTHILEQPKLIVTTDEQITLQTHGDKLMKIDLPLTVEPRGLVPEVLSVSLFQDDDITFADGTRRMDLTKQPVYFAADYLMQIKFGSSWASTILQPNRELFRLRVGAKTLTGDVVQADLACQVSRRDRSKSIGLTLDNTSLWDIYPGIGNQPARDDEFIGRVKELEQLRAVLVSAKKPTPVLLTGMRRVGKTSLLQEFHKNYRQPNKTDTVTVYLSLAEKRASLKEKTKDVSAVIFSKIVNVLAKRISNTDPNNELVSKIQTKFNCEWQVIRNKLQSCYDNESFSDSLVHLSETVIALIGSNCKRIVYLVDEAETLVIPYQEGGIKRAELEQFLQSLREISQNSECIGIVLSGSNHIDVFSREYKNAFFGSCLPISLKGLDNLTDCGHIIAPQRIRAYVQFDQSAIQYAAEISAGMPLFLWQLGAATAALVRSGPARRTDVRRAVQALVFDDGSLPFKAYEILEPLEHMLGLRPQPEPDLLWMLLYRLAQSTSLVAPEANIGFILDQTLLSMRDKDVWRQYLVSLTEIGILEIPRTGEYRFKIPIFAEGFRAQKQWSEFTLRHQRATI